MPPVGESDVLKRAKAYATEIQQLNRPQQLSWFGKQLAIRPEVLLRLIGYRSDAAKRYADAGESVERLAKRKPVQTLWLTELLREMVARHGYDVRRVAGLLKGPPPGVVDVPIPIPPKATGDAMKGVSRLLLKKIRTGGPTVFHDLTDYVRLSQSGRDGVPKTRTKG